MRSLELFIFAFAQNEYISNFIQGISKQRQMNHARLGTSLSSTSLDAMNAPTTFKDILPQAV